MTSSFILRQAASICHQGGIIAYPTEAVYGLGCDPMNRQAVSCILSLKNRPVEKGLILIGSDIQQLLPYAVLTARQIDKIRQQKTAVTWLVKKSPTTPSWISGTHEKLAIRLTQHAGARELCSTIGYAIVSTSANPGNHPPARSRLMVKHYFGDSIDMIVPGPLGSLTRPTEIRDIDSDRIIRAN